MAHLQFYRCDTCGKDLENTECSKNQVLYCLAELFDYGGKFHFCSLKCLRRFVNQKPSKFKHKIKKGELFTDMTLGEIWHFFEGNGNKEFLNQEVIDKNDKS